MPTGKNVVYVANVLRLDSFHEERYTGVHEGPFNARWYGHNHDITHKSKKGKKGTRLINYIFKLKPAPPNSIWAGVGYTWQRKTI